MAPDVLNTLAGGGIAIVGAMLGAWWTTRHAARDRHRRACQEILRFTRRISEALRTEDTRRREVREAADDVAERRRRTKPSSDDSLDALLDLDEIGESRLTYLRSRHDAVAAEVNQLAGELAILASIFVAAPSDSL